MNRKMLPNWYKNYKVLIEESIEKYLMDYFKASENQGLDTLKEAALYATKGGKRVRSILAIEFYLLISGKSFNDLKENDDIVKFTIALELLHAYSLVHDDLPAIDNDTLRRGESTTWKKYGESTGILTGDLLQTLSFEVLSEIGNIALIREFGKAVGFYGMLGGQVLDIYYEENNSSLDLNILEEIHNKKTGKLIQVSVLGGLILGNLSLDQENKKGKGDLEKYLNFGKKLGLAFQIKDDLLDVEGTFEETGKSVGGEEKGFVYFLGVEKSRERLNKLLDNCRKDIENLDSEKLEFLVDYIGDRKR